MSSVIVHAVDKDTGLLMLNRPEAYNALDTDMLHILLNNVISLEKEKRILIFTGSGEKAFCAGADVKKMSLMTSSEIKAFIALGQQTFRAIESSKTITIAALNGLAFGGGLELALSCDFIFAVSGIKMGLPELTLGLIPGFGGTQRLAKVLGKSHALEYIAGAKLFSSEEAHKMKLVHRCLPFDDLITQTLEFSRQFLKLPGYAQTNAKMAINNFGKVDYEKGFELESHLFYDCFINPERPGYFERFLNKKKDNS